MPKTTHILREHLEKVSWTVMRDYPEAIRKFTRGHAGIYALYRRDKLYYVGLASNLIGRLKAHLRDRHNGSWDRFSVYITARSEHIKELESLLLRIIDPAGNRMSGKLKASHNLRSDLNRLMKDKDADRRAAILGGKVASRRRRSKASRAGRDEKLASIVDRRYVLKGWHKGFVYSASLRRNGTIRYGDEIFDSPFRAASAALGRRANGWSFWHYKDKKSGEWVALRTLKK